jgi:hypothetical protein
MALCTESVPGTCRCFASRRYACRAAASFVASRHCEWQRICGHAFEGFRVRLKRTSCKIAQRESYNMRRHRERAACIIHHASCRTCSSSCKVKKGREELINCMTMMMMMKICHRVDDAMSAPCCCSSLCRSRREKENHQRTTRRFLSRQSRWPRYSTTETMCAPLNVGKYVQYHYRCPFHALARV